MGTKKGVQGPPPDLSPEASEAVLEAIRGSAEPVPAKAVAALLAADYGASEAQISPVLEAHVTAGVLQKYLATTAKGKPRYWDRDLQTVKRDAVLQVARDSDLPLTAKDVAGKIKVPKTTEAEATAILDEAVASLSLHALPPLKPKGKTLYWIDDFQAIARQAALDAAAQDEEPFTAKELATRLTTPIKLLEGDVARILDEAVAMGDLHSIPPKTSTGKPRYWRGDLLEFGCISVLHVINTKGPQTAVSLKKELKGLNETQVKEAIAHLRSEGAISRHPSLGTVKNEIYGTQPPSPVPYLSNVGRQLKQTVALLKTAHVPLEELRRAVVQLIEEAGIPFGTTSPTQSSSPGRTVVDETSIDLIALMKRIEPGSERGALVGARELRRAAQMAKTAFDQRVLQLARQGRLSLHRHDYASSLSQTERDELVTDGDGAYYVGMALRTE